MGSANSHQLIRKGKSRSIVFAGIDLAKIVFALHGVNLAGKAKLVRPGCHAVARLVERSDRGHRARTHGDRARFLRSKREAAK